MLSVSKEREQLTGIVYESNQARRHSDAVLGNPSAASPFKLYPDSIPKPTAAAAAEKVGGPIRDVRNLGNQQGWDFHYPLHGQALFSFEVARQLMREHRQNFAVYCG